MESLVRGPGPCVLLDTVEPEPVSVGDSLKSLTGLRILIAEDESLIAFDLESTLSHFGCSVVGPVSRIEDVLAMAQSERLDGALLDVNLRGRQIFEVLPGVLASGLKVVLTSGYDDATLFPDAYRSLPRVSKPFDERSLRQACEKFFLP